VKRYAILIMLVAASSLVHAAAEPVKMIACDPALVMEPQDIRMYGFIPAKRTPVSGIVHPKAVIARMLGTGMPICVAIDSDKADAETLGVLRFDFGGAGKFAGDLAASLKLPGPVKRGRRVNFGPATLTVKRDGKTIPVTVKGSYITHSDTDHQLTLQLGTALESICTFGDKSRTVRLVDGSTNLTCTDKATRAAKPGGLNGHDTVVVYDGDGSLIKGYYGHPILVGGTWYDVTLSADGAKIAVSATDVEMAMLKIAQQGWTARLFGGKYILNFRGSDKPMAIPADRYTFGQFRQLSAPDAKGRTGSFGLTWVRNYRKPGQDDKKFDAVAGETAEVSIGTPLTARADASVEGRAVELTLTVLDVSGAEVDRVVLPEGKWALPKFRILDEKGKVVHSGKLGFT
jgi:hypothetical protein